MSTLPTSITLKTNHGNIKLELDFSHFLGQAHSKGKKLPSKISLEDMMLREIVKSNDLKLRLFKDKIKEYKCESCLLFEWIGEKIPLELHHIDCNPKNNKLENLKIVCSNCHSIIHKKLKKKKEYIPRIKKDNVYVARPTRRKVIWPTSEELQKLVWEIPTIHISKKFGVSDKTVEKWCKLFKIIKPKRGYWQKLKNVVAL